MMSMWMCTWAVIIMVILLVIEEEVGEVATAIELHHSVYFSSVAVVSNSLWPHELHRARIPVHHQLPEKTQTHVHWVGNAIQSSHPLVFPISSCLQSFPASGSLPMSQFFTSGSQSIGVSVSAWVLPMDIQDLFPLGWTSWISLYSKGLSRVFSNTTD